VTVNFNVNKMTVNETNNFFGLGSLQLSFRANKDKFKNKQKESKYNQHDLQLNTKDNFELEKTNPVPKKQDTIRPDNSNCCIICVGSTGTGKSSTVGKYTGVQTRAGSGTERVTKNCEIHRSLTDDQEPVWVDTVGWDDAECEDDQTFKDILMFINKYDITKVSAIVWNIVPNVRRDALLMNQARLINLFKESEIWNNVLIVAKQSLNPKVDCQGAVQAAQQFTDVPILNTGYRFYNDPTVSAEQRDSFRSTQSRTLFNVKTDDEIRSILRESLGRMGEPVQVVFNTSKCKDCSVVADRRLLPKYCHMEPHLIHHGGIENHHPGKIERFHPSQHQVLEHDGRLKKTWYSHFLCGTLRKPRYSCCGRRSGKEGCHKKWACCKAEWDTTLGDDRGCSSRHKCCGASTSHSTGGCSPRYNCCLEEVTAKGCKKVCKKCGMDWGLPTEDCFIKEHNTVEIGVEEEKKEDECDDVGVDDNEEDVFIRSDDIVREKKKPLKKFDLIEKFPPIITYHII